MSLRHQLVALYVLKQADKDRYEVFYMSLRSQLADLNVLNSQLEVTYDSVSSSTRMLDMTLDNFTLALLYVT